MLRLLLIAVVAISLVGCKEAEKTKVTIPVEFKIEIPAQSITPLATPTATLEEKKIQFAEAWLTLQAEKAKAAQE